MATPEEARLSPELAASVCGIVVVFAALQSVFGVGILVFGTPSLLLLGLPFEQVLAYLLPSSLTISALQVARGGGLRLEPIRRQLLIWTAPAVLVGSALVHLPELQTVVPGLVGAMLIASALLRLRDPTRRATASFVREHRPALLAGLGLVHGLSNLGGGVLTLLIGSLFEDRHAIRRHIAFAYGLMASLQLVTLFALGSPRVEWWLVLLLPPLAAATFRSVGERLFAATGESVYQSALTVLIAALGLLLLLKIDLVA
jgi:hypothetical protein